MSLTVTVFFYPHLQSLLQHGRSGQQKHSSGGPVVTFSEQYEGVLAGHCSPTGRAEVVSEQLFQALTGGQTLRWKSC